MAKKDLWKQIKQEYPETVAALGNFYASRAGISLEQWELTLESCIGGVLYGYEPIPFEEAREVVRKVKMLVPPFDKQVGWTDKKGEEFVEFYASAEDLRDAYFSGIDEVLVGE